MESSKDSIVDGCDYLVPIEFDFDIDNMICMTFVLLSKFVSLSRLL